jgi:hypothetical protein
MCVYIYVAMLMTAKMYQDGKVFSGKIFTLREKSQSFFFVINENEYSYPLIYRMRPSLYTSTILKSMVRLVAVLNCHVDNPHTRRSVNQALLTFSTNMLALRTVNLNNNKIKKPRTAQTRRLQTLIWFS